VRKAVHVARPEYKAASQLERIAAQAMLARSCGFGAIARRKIVAPQQVEHVPGAQVDGHIGLFVFIDQQWKRDAGLFPELLGVSNIAQPDGSQIGALGGELGGVVAQLRDVLAAKDSTIVPQEHKYCRLRFI